MKTTGKPIIQRVTVFSGTNICSFVKLVRQPFVFVIWIGHFLQTTIVMRFSKVCYSDPQYSGDLKPDHFKSILFDGQISNGRVFKCRDLAMAIVPTIQKLDHSKYFFVQISNVFFPKWLPFVWFSNGWAYKFQIPFEILSICKPTSFWPIKIQTSPNFRSHCKLNRLLPC